eukprot:12414888-Ditylum_brightwellii.AAC.1
MEIGCFSLEESVNLLLHGADDDDEEEDDECNDDKEKEEEEEAFSPNLRAVAVKIASRCGNLPSAIASSIRWINHMRNSSSTSKNNKTKNNTFRNALEELSMTLDKSNFFECDPELKSKLDLFESLDH